MSLYLARPMRHLSRFLGTLLASAVALDFLQAGAAEVVQISSGSCSPNISNVGGSVSVQCSLNVPPEVVDKIEQRIKLLTGTSSSKPSRKELLTIVRDTIQSELLNSLNADPKNHMIGHLITRVEKFPEKSDIATEILINRLAAGVYAGALHSNIDSSALTPQALESIIGFATQLGRVCPVMILISAYTAKICPGKIRKQCGQSDELLPRTRLYSQKLSVQYAETVKAVIRQEVTRVAPSCAMNILTEGRGLDNPEIPYPPVATATAREWEAAASRNSRVIVSVMF